MRSFVLPELARRWWAGELGARGRVLDAAFAPAEWGYRGITRVRNALYDAGMLRVQHPGIPVISVGNIAVGGAGKTPFAAWLVQELLRRGRRPAVLHGGYAPDEPALHRAWAPQVPVLAQRDRVAAAADARAAGADVLVLDDAFQHRRIARDLDLVLVAAERWSASPRLLPRGGWREAPAGLRRATHLAVTRRVATAAAAAAVASALARLVPGVPVLRVRLEPGGWVDGLGQPTAAPRDALLVAAVALPEAFEANARSAGAELSRARYWPDHYDYRAADAAALLREAGTAPLVTTAKDWVKLASWVPPGRVRVLRQNVVLEAGEQVLMQSLERVLGG